MFNIGIVDRLLRIVGLHLVISLIDSGVIEFSIFTYLFSIIAIYLLLTAILGIDPIYRIIKLNTKENSLTN